MCGIGQKGTWIREIKAKTSVHKTSLDKILKTLESRKLIKAVKTIANKNRKVYMLYDMMPSAEITGGPWYSEQEFDHAFVESLSKFVFQCVATLKMASLDMLTEKVSSGVVHCTCPSLR
jgi:DNA-directed RNA polymerase III subunit RPC6